MSEQTTASGTGGYRIELLGSKNWMPWKRRMLAILRDLNLEDYIEKESTSPVAKEPGNPTDVEKGLIKAWKTGDAKARTRIELAIGDAEMIHISGANTAKEMWEQLKTVKESRGRLGVLATRRALYRASAADDFEMVDHISNLRKLQEELHLMGSIVSDEDFVMILITSLPEAWDNYTSAYLGSSGNKPELKSHEIIAILLDEDRRRKGRSGNSGETALQAKGKAKEKKKDCECYNCKKRGHMAKDCWEKGGGMEGKGPKGRKGPNREKANQAEEVNTSLNDVAYMAGGQIVKSKDLWYLDSGTTSHISNNRDVYIDFVNTKPTPITGIGSSAISTGYGTIPIEFKVKNKIFTHKLHHVLYLPDAPNCLISVSRFDEKGGRAIFYKGECFLEGKDKVIIGHGKMCGRLYLLDATAINSNESSLYVSSPKLSWDQWHRRYGHISTTTLDRISKRGIVDGLSIDQSTIPSNTCEACIQAKQAHKPFPKEAENRSEVPGERVMSDVWGPARVESIGKWRWYISFVDDCTRNGNVLFMKQKSDATGRIKEHLTKIHRHFGKWPKWMRIDNGKEFMNEEIKKWAAERGITLETTAPYSPSQNGVAERFNWTLLELARAMMIAKNLPILLWDEAVSHANYLRNRSSTVALKDMTPQEAYTNKKPDVSHLREFGCDVWVLDESGTRSKLDPKSKKMIFVGFMDGPKAIRYYDAKNRSIKVSRNVAFNENEEPRELEIREVPGLQVEGEKEVEVIQEDILSTQQTQSIQDKPTTTIPTTEPQKRQLRTTTFMDYSKINNTDSRRSSTRQAHRSPENATEASGLAE